MGLFANFDDHARDRDGQGCLVDPGQAAACLRQRARQISARIAALVCVLTLSLTTTLQAETLRVATFNAELSRKGPGLLLRDISRGGDPQIEALRDLLVRVQPDVLTLQGFDYDLEGRALAAFIDTLGDAGLRYPYTFAAPPNAGRRTGADMDGDGTFGGAADGQGYGRFFGAGSMALLSRLPIDLPGVQDFTSMLWRDMPGALLPKTDAGPFPSAAALQIQRLPSHGAWVVPIMHPDWGIFTVMTYHATPPVFDGPEDRNGKRNHDETRFWSLFLDGAFGPAPTTRFVLTGDANLDPTRGDGRGAAMRALLDNPALQDPLPGQATVSFAQTGPLRVDYLLPSSDWQVLDAQVAPVDPEISRHSLVWVDLKP